MKLNNNRRYFRKLLEDLPIEIIGAFSAYLLALIGTIIYISSGFWDVSSPFHINVFEILLLLALFIFYIFNFLYIYIVFSNIHDNLVKQYEKIVIYLFIIIINIISIYFYLGGDKFNSNRFIIYLLLFFIQFYSRLVLLIF